MTLSNLSPRYRLGRPKGKRDRPLKRPKLLLLLRLLSSVTSRFLDGHHPYNHLHRNHLHESPACHQRLKGRRQCQ